MKKKKILWAIGIAVVAIFLFYKLARMLAPGPAPFAESYEFDISKDQLIEVVQEFKIENPQYKVPEAVIISDGKNENDSLDERHYFYFYYPDANQIIYTWIWGSRRQSELLFISINEGLELGHWKDVNDDFGFFQNRRVKKTFEERILNQIQKRVEQLNKQKKYKKELQKAQWQFEKAEGNLLYFKSGQKVRTALYDLRYIGQLSTKNKAPYLILSGRSCVDCDENISIYIYSPSDGEMKSGGKQSRYSFPGKELDYATNELLFENRMFYGNCLDAETPSVVWIERTFMDKNWKSTAFIVTIENDTIQEKKIKSPIIAKTILNMVKQCKELPGIVMTIEP